MSDNIVITHRASIVQKDEENFSIYCGSPFCTQFIDLCNAVVQRIQEFKRKGIIQNHMNKGAAMRIAATVQDGDVKYYQLTSLFNDEEEISPLYTGDNEVYDEHNIY